MSEPFVVIIPEETKDYKNDLKKKGDKILRQTYFKIVRKDKKGNMIPTTMDRSDAKDIIKKLTSKFKDNSFTVTVFYENKGWLSCPRGKFNADESPSFHEERYGHEEDYGEISDFIIYSYPKVPETV